MIKMLNAYTLEADDADDALEEINGMIGDGLLKNSLGILSCYDEFVDTGVAQHIAANLPFDVVGFTTLATAVDGEYDPVMLTLAVITSDELEFSCRMSGKLEADSEDTIRTAYAAATEGRDGDPKLIFTFMPVIEAGPERPLAALNKVSGGVPQFGTVASDGSKDLGKTYTIFNGNVSLENMVFSLVYGNIEPTFVVAHMPEGKIQAQNAVITDSEDCLLKGVNGMPIIEYLESIGVVLGDDRAGMGAIPFVVDFQDGTMPFARAIYNILPDGSALCGGFMPKGATLSIGSIDRDDVIITAELSLQDMVATGKRNGLLVLPCMTRYLVAGGDMRAEIDIARDISGDIPCFLSYSGGEICPVYDEDGKPVNRFHNFTFTACIF